MTMKEHFDRLNGHLHKAVFELCEKEPEKGQEAMKHLFEIIRNYNAILRLADIEIKHDIVMTDEE